MDLIIIILLVLFIMILIIRHIYKSSSEIERIPDRNFVPYSSSSQSTEIKTYDAPKYNVNNVSVIKFQVAGLYYRPYYNQHRAAQLKINEPLQLIAEPDNNFDPNAIKVMTMDNVEIGYMPKNLAAQWNAFLDKLYECHIISNYPDGDINNIEAAAIFNCVTTETYDFIVEDYYISSQYEEKFPELKDLFYNSEEELNQKLTKIKSYIEIYKNDFFLRYNYLSILKRLKHYNDALSYIDEIIHDFPVSKDSTCIKNERKFIEKHINEINERELKMQMDFNLGQAKIFMQEKRYNEALPLLMFCYDNNLCQQKIVIDICKCYKNIKDKEGLIQFANDALKKDWISPKTAGTLTAIISL